MGKMKELWASEQNRDNGDDTYIEWCMKFQSVPDKYTPSYENWWNKNYGPERKEIYKKKTKGV